MPNPAKVEGQLPRFGWSDAGLAGKPLTGFGWSQSEDAISLRLGFAYRTHSKLSSYDQPASRYSFGTGSDRQLDV